MTWWVLLLRRARWAPVVDAGVVVLLVLVGVLAAVLVVAGPAVLRAAVQQRVDATDAASAPPPPVRVVGLWSARDPKDAFWRGEPLELTGLQRTGVRGPLVVAEGAAAHLPVEWTAHWRALPDLRRLTPELV